ncbi:nucleotidyl transferase AbiEii/AbiGii toxin family protein [Pseudomonas sp. GX19020]|uniref:nucleotidyl transferase AbiEii/AbiGii toxin family protein n=1 Tax=Pseudomonas sp. GX19020 TaxID=2942277 RepID=UPI0020196F4C|nr:nucleotidyl transferase AbiEii/AbiGii toxin family protein [Pseudomonas sp. GX19020]MCL4069493.1 nucleotidyl transferase AbiEii/AbiGii toxin family protein [Pseudomonas sp. GX19020]
MMNPAYDQILAADAQTRAGVFTTTAQRLGTTLQNVEKDFWVCWTLDALFNGLTDRPRLLFKGGTSLSKGFGLIRRFSEDIDVTVFRDDLGESASIEELQALSGKKRGEALDAIKAACEAYINGPCLTGLSGIVEEAAQRNGLSSGHFRVEADPHDSQALYLRYPSATPEDDYIAKAVKIESGAKSALDPNSARIIRPYIEADVPGVDLGVADVTTVDVERTLWDKIVILHGLRRWFDNRGELRGDGQRVSRHYYDVCQLLISDAGKNALKDRDLAEDCVAHARMFFNRPAFDLATAAPPTFSIRPEGKMLDDLRRDYRAMAGMIFGEAPAFEAIIESISGLEVALNSVKQETELGGESGDA